MSSYDLLIGVTESRLNAILAQVYASDQLRRSLFSGSQAGDFTDINYQVDWSVGVAPTISLRAPTPDEWNASVKGGGGPAAPQAGAFLVSLSSLSVKLQATGESLDTTVPVRAICSVAAESGRLSIMALAVIVNLAAASDLDRYLIESVMVPQILDMLNKTLSGISIPQVNIMGMSLTPPVVGITNGYLLTAFNLVQSGTPSPDGAVIPGDPFFVLLSRQLVQSAVDYQVRTNLQGKTFDQSGSEGGGGFSAEYSVHGRIDGIAAATTSNSTALRAVASLSMSASAGITTPVGVVVRVIEDIGKRIIDPDTWDPTKW